MKRPLQDIESKVNGLVGNIDLALQDKSNRFPFITMLTAMLKYGLRLKIIKWRPLTIDVELKNEPNPDS